MDIIELILDEDSEGLTGIEAVSIVEMPAIESDFVTLSEQEIKLAKIDDEKRLLMGAALIPNKPIFRKNGENTFYVYFSEKTVRRASELFFQNSMQNNATLEHEMEINNLTVVESWIVEDTEKDKTAFYGLKYPVGTWVGSVKVHSDKVWQEFVKTGAVKGLEEKLIKQYKSQGMEFLDAIKKAQIEAGGVRYEGKIKIIDGGCIQQLNPSNREPLKTCF